MTDENLEEKYKILENKYKRKLALYGILGTLALGASTGLDWWVYKNGHNEGYQEGKEAGVVEAQESAEAPEVRIELMDSCLGERVKDVEISIKQTMDGKKITYNLRTSQNVTYAEPHQPGTSIYESVFIELNKDEAVEYVDAYNWGVQNFETSCQGKAHDGLVDIIQYSNTQGYPLLCRERDYEANKAAFDEADESLKNARKEYGLE